MELKIRVSQLHRIMSASGKLTQTNKTYIEECAIYDLFGIREHVSTKPMQKGIILEQEAIDLVNRNEFTNYVKSDKRGDLGWLTGHPDTIKIGRASCREREKGSKVEISLKKK